MVLNVDRDVPVPADAKAVIVAQNLIAARYVQLTPAYRTTRPEDGRRCGDSQRPDGRARRVGRGQEATDAPGNRIRARASEASSDTSVGRFIDSAANALDGNGEKLRPDAGRTVGGGRILAEGSGNIVGIIKNLQIFVTALRDSNQQIVTFNNRLATLSSVLDGSRSDLDAALTDLSVGVGEVQRFVAGTRNQTAEQVQGLANVTQNLVDHQETSSRCCTSRRTRSPTPTTSTTRHRRGPRRVRVHQLRQPGAVHLRHDRRVAEHHRARDRETVRAIPRPRAAAAQPQLHPAPDQPVPAAVAEPRNIIYADPRLAPGGAGPGDPPETRRRCPRTPGWTATCRRRRAWGAPPAAAGRHPSDTR